MEPKLGEVIDVVDEMVPGALAEDWDNSGLQVGDRHWHVKRVWVALDPLPEVIAAAGASGVDLLITHHPLIFKPLSMIDTRTMEGAAVQQALAHQVAVFSAHTNLDRTYEGVNDVLAAKIGLDDIRPLPMESAQDAPGFGRIGKLAQAGMDRGEIKPGSARELGRIILTVADAIKLATCSEPGQRPPETIDYSQVEKDVVYAVTLMLDGLAVPSGEK